MKHYKDLTSEEFSDLAENNSEFLHSIRDSYEDDIYTWTRDYFDQLSGAFCDYQYGNNCRCWVKIAEDDYFGYQYGNALTELISANDGAEFMLSDDAIAAAERCIEICNRYYELRNELSAENAERMENRIEEIVEEIENEIGNLMQEQFEFDDCVAIESAVCHMDDFEDDDTLVDIDTWELISA